MIFRNSIFINFFNNCDYINAFVILLCIYYLQQSNKDWKILYIHHKTNMIIFKISLTKVNPIHTSIDLFILEPQSLQNDLAPIIIHTKRKKKNMNIINGKYFTYEYLMKPKQSLVFFCVLSIKAYIIEKTMAYCHIYPFMISHMLRLTVGVISSI